MKKKKRIKNNSKKNLNLNSTKKNQFTSLKYINNPMNQFGVINNEKYNNDKLHTLNTQGNKVNRKKLDIFFSPETLHFKSINNSSIKKEKKKTEFKSNIDGSKTPINISQTLPKKRSNNFNYINTEIKSNGRNKLFKSKEIQRRTKKKNRFEDIIFNQVNNIIYKNDSSGKKNNTQNEVDTKEKEGNQIKDNIFGKIKKQSKIRHDKNKINDNNNNY
jgi:hypothetical protein